MLKIVYFKNESCQVCNALLPKINRIANEFSLPLNVIDVVQYKEIAAQNMVFSVPAVLIFDENDKEMIRFVRNFSEFEIKNYLERLISLMS